MGESNFRDSKVTLQCCDTNTCPGQVTSGMSVLVHTRLWLGLTRYLKVSVVPEQSMQHKHGNPEDSALPLDNL